VLYALPFPVIDPVAISIGPLAVRWYALAYIAGILIGWRWALSVARRTPKHVSERDIDDFVVWATVGIVLGGRLGYVLFYKPGFYLFNPLEALQIWRGGMSFHGGLIGVVTAMVLFARRRGVRFWALADVIACATPIGLFFGRIANFVNAELYGRVSDVPWAMVFPTGSPEPRHPSQLYQAFLEGVCVFAVMVVLERGLGKRERVGFLAGAFLVSYGIARMIGELFREPDAHLGFLFAHVTMGQLLSLPMVLFGIWRMASARRS